MNEPPDPRPARRSLRRDADVRAVSRVTRGIAAAAVAGTVVVGGLAAGGVTNQATADSASTAATGAAPAIDGAAPAAADAYAAPDPGGYYYDDGGQAQPSGSLRAPQSAPAPSFQPPVAASGGS